MNDPGPQFEITKNEEDFLLGKLGGAKSSGVYVPAEFASRLREILDAVRIRIGSSGNTELPDAVKNLFGVLGRVLDAHGKQMNVEFEAKVPKFEKALEEIERLLKDFDGNDDGPKRA